MELLEQKKVISKEESDCLGLSEEQFAALQYAEARMINEQVFQRIKLHDGIPSPVQVLTKDEKKKERLVLEYVLFGDASGGLFMKFEGCDILKAGYPLKEATDTLDEVKKTLMAYLSGFKDMLTQSKVRTGLYLLFFHREVYASLVNLLIYMRRRVKPYRLKPHYYCRMVRELNRVFDIMAPSFASRDVIRNLQVLASVFLEFDDAYRYRFQYVMGKMNREELLRNPHRELERLLRIGEERETSSRVANSWRILRLILRITRYDPFYRSYANIVQFFASLNINEIRLTPDDEYYAHQKKDFRW